MIQIDIDMPKQCINCPLCKHIHLADSPLLIYACGKGMRPIYSHETAEGVDEFSKMEKPEWCPLKEVKHGKWQIEISDDGHQATYQCSECGHQFKWIYDPLFSPVFNYCQKCGSRMEE